MDRHSLRLRDDGDINHLPPRIIERSGRMQTY
ncbi:hypothetical protein SAMN05216210_1666 [Halopseudomonas salegens]|uniref:Uncharacterized protein n=1 Tax=Halopseudomonas salegens TaxID=1434072 RepID=A0A1H2FMB2_9GAMM|nr:hypothetical protein SAMN05216210_1666 [Halopseudomonas salegens]